MILEKYTVYMDTQEGSIIFYSEEFMFEFAKWCGNNYIKLTKGWVKNKTYSRDTQYNEFYTTKELLEEFKKSKDAV